LRYIFGITVLLCLLCLSTSGICQDEEPLAPEWLFDDEEEIANWGAPNQLMPLEFDEVKDKKDNIRTILLIVSTGSDPYIFPGGDWNGFVPDIGSFDGGEYDTIYVGIRVNVSCTWQIYYITEDDMAYAEAQRQDFQINASDNFEDLEFVMERGGWQDRVVKGFRLDPGTVAGVEAEIDYLSLRGIPEDLVPKALESGGKLAVTWGTIKDR